MEENRSHFRVFLFLMAFGGFLFAIVHRATVHLAVAYNTDWGLALVTSQLVTDLPATLLAFILALTIPRWYNFRAYGRGLCFGYVIYLLLFGTVLVTLGGVLNNPSFQAANLYVYVLIGKVFLASLVVYLWGFANHLHTFKVACWHYPLFALAFALGLSVGTLSEALFQYLALAAADQLVMAWSMTTIATALYGITLWKATTHIAAANATPLPSKLDKGRGSIWRFVTPLALVLGAVDAIYGLSAATWKVQISQFFISAEAYTAFLEQYLVAHGIAALFTFVLLGALAFYLRAKGVRGWIVAGVAFAAMAFALQMVWAWYGPDAGPIIPSSSLTLLSALTIPILGVLGRIAYTALPDHQRWCALVWIELLLAPILQWSLPAAILSIPAIPQLVAMGVLWVIVFVGLLFVYKVINVEEKNRV